MKKMLFLMLASGLNALAIAQTVIAPATDDKPVWATIADPEFTLRYPPNWTLDQTGLFGSNFFLYAPFETRNDTFRENFNLIINDLSEFPGIPLAEVAEGARQQIVGMINDVKILEFKEVPDGFEKYYHIEYTGVQGKFKLHWRQHYWLVHNHFYVLTFTAEEPDYARYLPLAEAIFDSFFLK